jgi:hypothetical protein
MTPSTINPAFLIEGAAVIIAASTFIWLVIFVTVETIKKNRKVK